MQRQRQRGAEAEAGQRGRGREVEAEAERQEQSTSPRELQTAALQRCDKQGAGVQVMRKHTTLMASADSQKYLESLQNSLQHWHGSARQVQEWTHRQELSQ